MKYTVLYQGDSVPGEEDLRTPMSDSLDLGRAVRGQIAGFLVPSFTLICQQGKLLIRRVDSYHRHIGLLKLTAMERRATLRRCHMGICCSFCQRKKNQGLRPI
jgi:L-lysine 2,3-aminomutase